MCQRLSDLGLEYAEAAQREGVRELQPRPPRGLQPSGAYMPPSPPSFRDATLAEVFATLSRCVRQAILLEARLDSGAYDQPPPARNTPADPAPKRSPEKPRASEPGDGTSLHYERLEDDLAADANRPADEILVEICQTLGQFIESKQAPAHAPLVLPRTPHHSVPPPEPTRQPQPNRPPDKPPLKPG